MYDVYAANDRTAQLHYDGPYTFNYIEWVHLRCRGCGRLIGFHYSRRPDIFCGECEGIRGE